MDRQISWKDSVVTNGFWKRQQTLCARVGIPKIYQFFKDSGRMDSMRGLYVASPDGRDELLDRANGKEEGAFLEDGTIILYSLAQLQGEQMEIDPDRAPRPHQYWDSDVAKIIESEAYVLLGQRDPEAEAVIDDIVDAYEKIQEPDGYLNTYFTFVEPGKRFTNLQEKHELYCAGHMLEAAIAYFEATDKRKYLDMMIRYIDLIDATFGPEEGKLHGYPGHEEIELALMKLYRLTGEKRYFHLARYFIEERGQDPLYFDVESAREHRNPNIPKGKGFNVRNGFSQGPYAELQSHLPVKEQKEATGHAVRLMYLCCGLTDVAAESGDESLIRAARDLWENVTRKKMYITGGIGQDAHGERFAFEYHLPNEESYNETCAAVGFAMWASRMLQLKADSEYSDVLERIVYNGFLSGMSLDGKSYFYANHLQCMPQMYVDRVERQTRMFPTRQSDFPVCCCPPNIMRFIESVSGYALTQSEDTVYVHLYMGSDTRLQIHGQEVVLSQTTEYPLEETVTFKVRTSQPAAFRLGLHIPGWCRNWSVRVNRQDMDAGKLKDGYLILDRTWKDGDCVELTLLMTPFLIEASPHVRMDCGRVAIQCGPFMYCLEEADNGKDLSDITIGSDVQFEKHFDPGLLGGTPVLTANAWRRRPEEWKDTLYKVLGSGYEKIRITAIPYYLWSNRRIGEMIMWIRCR